MAKVYFFVSKSFTYGLSWWPDRHHLWKAVVNGLQQELYNVDTEALMQQSYWLELGTRGCEDAFGLSSTLWVVYAFMCTSHVHNDVLFYLSVYHVCVWICISLQKTLSILTQKLCLHFHFPSLAGLSPNLPWQLLSTRQAWSFPLNPLSNAA